MLEDSTPMSQVELQALAALQHLNANERKKVLDYLKNLIILEKVKNDQGKPT